MERNDNYNRSENASKGDVSEMSGGSVTTESSSVEQKADDTKNEENEDKIAKTGQVTVGIDNVMVRTDNAKIGNGGNTIDLPKTPVTEKAYSSEREELKCVVKNGTTKSLDGDKTPENQIVNEDNKSSDRNTNETNADKRNVVVIQKPKRTKSRKSLNRMYSVNNVDLDIKGNATIQRTDR